MKSKLKSILGVLLMLSTLSVYAQVDVRGVVLEATNNEPLIGVNIILKNTTEGTVSDIDGSYSLTATSTEDYVIFSYLGYTEKEVMVADLLEDGTVRLDEGLALEEVVVTALGIKREEKALGYAAQALSNKELDLVRSSSPFTALKGKVAGLQVNSASNGPASSSRIVIRGEKSLNIDDNSPLIVVDGTPVNNDIIGVGGFNTDQANLPTDYGNAANEINPNDIESINVLKGAAASALYGSRGGNGVIIITTKSGENQEGFGVNLSTNTSFSSPLRLPEVQTQYGGGWGGKYYSDYGTNFGPKYGGSETFPQDGHPGFSKGEKIPYQFRYDMNDFFQQGLSTANQVSISKKLDFGSFRASYGNTYTKGIIPNTNLKRNNLTLHTKIDISDRWDVNLSGMYINSNSDNLPVAGYGNQGIMYTLLWNYTNVDLNWLKDYWAEKDVKQNKLFSWGDNPFFIAHENINGFDKNRLIANINTTYKITPELSLMMRVGRDGFSDGRVSRRPWSAVRFPTGMYREQNINFSEINKDFLLTYNKRFDDISLVLSAGANRMDQSIKNSIIFGNGLTIPGIYTLGNISTKPDARSSDQKRRTNSVYAFANLGYKDFVYLDLTARNDWSSTLPAANNSYFYPSASLSFLLSEVVDMGRLVDLVKLRANYAQSGIDAKPYSLQTYYQFDRLPGTVRNSPSLANADLKPVLNTSTEFGIQAKFFNRRLGFDFATFRTLSKDQIISASISEASGFKQKIINAGEIESSGIELSLNGSPVRTSDFEWNVGVNYSTFSSKVNKLFEGIDTYVIAQGPAGATVEARVGGELGDIYGNVYKRHNGQIVYGSNGVPQLDSERKKIGNYNPDFLMGANTTLYYKGFSAYALFNIRQGGYIYSYTNAIGAESGILSHSVSNHEEGFVGDGLMLDADGNYVTNTNKASAETWYYYGGNYDRSNVEANGFDASFVKLKEVSLGYTFPERITKPLGLQRLGVALTGNNLALWTDVPHIDPEAQALNGGSIVPGFEVTQLPSTRAIGFKVNVGF